VRHLYVHVPFCRRRCSYCDFAIAVRKTVPSDRFVEAVLAEFAMRRELEGWVPGPFDTVYLGGGTPSLLSPEAVAKLIDAFPRAADAEVTLEANPDDVTPHAAAAWVAAGVNRVSLGVQSLDDRALTWMHRMHDAGAARRAAAALREAGVGSLSVDLIFAVPEALERDLPADLRELLALGPDHVSAYGLTLEPRTPYARWSDRGLSAPPPDERYAAEFMLVHETLGEAGFEHYEISNYARPGARSRHNSAYWQGVDYLGLGPSAHGLQRGVRRWNLRHWTAWDRCVASGADPIGGSERLTASEATLERVYLRLRTAEGIPPAEAGNLAPGPRLAAEHAGWLATEDGWVLATPAGWLVLDGLVPGLTTFSEGG
jgi:oxygen-independent coproporphyrinogen III oxidase